MFKIPASIAQDLLLIQDLVGTPLATLQKKVESGPEPNSSTGKPSFEKRPTVDQPESDSEDEVEANLSVDHENDVLDPPNSLCVYSAIYSENSIIFT